MMQLLRDQARGAPISSSNSQEDRIGQFVLKEKIGQGTTGTVRLGINTSTGGKCAVKIVNKTVTRKRKEARKEIKRLERIRHDNIIALHHWEEDISNIYIFLEYCEHGDLWLFIQKHGVFNEETARKLVSQLVDAVDFCHRSMHICHHDIKLENCVITRDFRLKLIDYGFSIDLDPIPHRRDKSIRIYDSSPAYSPLEILQRKPHDETVDIYSIGVCLYYMLVGRFPFCTPDKTSLDELCHNVLNNDPHFPKGSVSLLGQHLICSMLAKRKRRASIEDIRSHEWFYSVDKQSEEEEEDDDM
ncbi:hypothetical protein PROFUN_01424 [Planoprotostelium fungivorum]|uniref:non-specific serine/threonine protein kinase n=1 Tax=Planoprotostelium fungivorum TaxID=1890364 RepID=A0A2P6NT68_9EUKA|nr:hypothetical protein PROFUN_01424 [Planoprotostelium fungivorum]